MCLILIEFVCRLQRPRQSKINIRKVFVIYLYIHCVNLFGDEMTQHRTYFSDHGQRWPHPRVVFAKRTGHPQVAVPQATDQNQYGTSRRHTQTQNAAQCLGQMLNKFSTSQPIPISRKANVNSGRALHKQHSSCFGSDSASMATTMSVGGHVHQYDGR